MPDPARIAQGQALEVPVILQGAKTDPGTGRRELFTESAKTALVFENGAMLKLQSRLLVGQPVFIHNQQNRKEILCKVLEAPPEGEDGYTDLEFTTANPEFWSVGAQQPQTAAQNPQPATAMPETQEQPESQAENSLAMMSSTVSTIVLPPAAARSEEPSGPRREILVPAHEAVPETSVVPAVAESSMPPNEPTGEQIDAALRQLSALPQSASSAEAAAEVDHAQTEANLAALMARDARLAKYAATKEKAAKEIGRIQDSQEASEGAPAVDGASEQKVVLAKMPLMQRLTTGKNAIIVQIVGWIAIVVSLGIIWHAERGLFVHESVRPPAVAAQPKPNAVPVPKPPSPAPAVAATAPATTAASSPASSSKAPQPTVPQASSAPAVKVARTTSASVGTRRAGNTAGAPLASAGALAETDRDALASDTGAAQPKHRKTSGQDPLEIVPARILQQPQPALPVWAKSLDVSNVVKLDAVIDEKGNVTVAKVLSGPRPLQRAAVQAVGLWQFAPAESAGKPIATHMVLTVEFQR